MPASNDFWVNTQIDLETVAGATLTITAIDKANPGVVHYTGPDPANGDVVTLEVGGMVEVNKRSFRVAAVDSAANTFALEGEDTTLYNTFTEGSASVKTLGASMQTVQDVNSGGGEYEFADLSTIHDGQRRRAPTVASPFTMTLGCLFRPEDAAHRELARANRTKTERTVRIRWPSGRIALFQAYIGASGLPTGGAFEVVKTNVTFEGQGAPTYY